jgi:hypothetical protein
MAITNPEAIRFVNEQVRPLCEEARALMARIGAAQTLWFSGVNGNVPNDATLLADGRDADGSSRLTGAHINSAVGNLIAIAAASNAQIIEKPCVRAIAVS